MLPAPCHTRTDSEKTAKKLSTFIHSTSSSFGQELYMSSVKFRTDGWLNVVFCFHRTFIQFVSLTHKLHSVRNMTSSLREKNAIGKYTSALRGGQCHITTCCIYMYTIIKCQVPEAVNKKEQRPKKLRQNQKGKQKCWHCRVVRDKRQRSKANRYIDNGSAL